MSFLKNEAPSEVLETLRQAEAQADECWRPLQILQNPSNVAVWALLAGGIGIVEREQAARGSDTPHFDAMLGNLSRLLAIAVKWGIRHGQPLAAPLVTRWTPALSAAVDQALPVATQYSHFEVCFQGFHKNRYAAEALTPTTLRFTVPGGERDRQVSAYQKGLRPREGRFAGRRAAQRPQEPRVAQGFEQVLSGCGQRTGPLSFDYGEPWDLWRELLPESGTGSRRLRDGRIHYRSATTGSTSSTSSMSRSLRFARCTTTCAFFGAGRIVPTQWNPP